MCKIKNGALISGAQKTKIVKASKVATKLAKGLTLGECPLPANGPVMCGLRDGELLCHR